MRGQLSLLLSQGHVHAEEYPVGMIWDEVALVVPRLNREEANRATLLQMAVSGVLSAKANKSFKEQITRLLKD